MRPVTLFVVLSVLVSLSAPAHARGRHGCPNRGGVNSGFVGGSSYGSGYGASYGGSGSSGLIGVSYGGVRYPSTLYASPTLAGPTSSNNSNQYKPYGPASYPDSYKAQYGSSPQNYGGGAVAGGGSASQAYGAGYTANQAYGSNASGGLTAYITPPAVAPSYQRPNPHIVTVNQEPPPAQAPAAQPQPQAQQPLMSALPGDIARSQQLYGNGLWVYDPSSQRVVFVPGASLPPVAAAAPQLQQPAAAVQAGYFTAPAQASVQPEDVIGPPATTAPHSP